MSKRKEAQHQHHREEEPAQQQKLYPVHQSATFAGGTFLATLPFDLFCHFGPTGLFVSGLASLVAWRHGPEIYDYVRGMLPTHSLVSSEDDEASALKEEPPAASSRQRSWLDRALAWSPEEEMAEPPTPGSAEPQHHGEQGEEAEDDEETAIFQTSQQQAHTTPLVSRITMEQALRHTARNSYQVYLYASSEKLRSESRPPAAWHQASEMS